MVLSLLNVIDEQIGMCVSLGLVAIFNLIVAIAAFKRDIRLVGVLMIVFMLVGLGLFGVNLYTMVNEEKEEKSKFQISVKENESERTKIFEHGSYKYNTYKLEEVDIAFEDKTYLLKDAFEVERITLDEILKMAIPDDNTVGYKIYYDGGSQGNDKYSVVVCEETKNVVFAPYSYKYDKSICDFSGED